MAIQQPNFVSAAPQRVEQKEPQKGSAEYNFREARRIMQEQNRRIQELEERERARKRKEANNG